MIIQPEQLTTRSLQVSPRGDDICKIMAAGINSTDPGEAIRRHVSRDADHLTLDHLCLDLNKINRLFVIGAGKATASMAIAINEILSDRITSGLVITKDGHLGPQDSSRISKIKVLEAKHPIPDQRNIDATIKLLTLMRGLRSDDLVLFLLSGGGSSLLVQPSPGISLQDIQATTALLLHCGATITEINTIRKHLDRIKGGGLAKLLNPARVITLILSDVVGDSMDMIASGPTVADPTTFLDARAILTKYQISDEVPHPIKSHISAGIDGLISETLKPGDPLLENVSNFMIGNNSDAISAANGLAREIGFNTAILTPSLQGEASDAGKILFEQAKSFINDNPTSDNHPACLIAGGETTVTIKGSGTGGRNQELASICHVPFRRGSVCSRQSRHRWWRRSHRCSWSSHNQ
jgi:hydroxypyruvate reductase